MQLRKYFENFDGPWSEIDKKLCDCIFSVNVVQQKSKPQIRKFQLIWCNLIEVTILTNFNEIETILVSFTKHGYFLSKLNSNLSWRQLCWNFTEIKSDFLQICQVWPKIAIFTMPWKWQKNRDNSKSEATKIVPNASLAWFREAWQNLHQLK